MFTLASALPLPYRGHVGTLRTDTLSFLTLDGWWQGAATFAQPDGGYVLAVNSELPTGGGASSISFAADSQRSSGVLARHFSITSATAELPG